MVMWAILAPTPCLLVQPKLLQHMASKGISGLPGSVLPLGIASEACTTLQLNPKSLKTLQALNPQTVIFSHPKA